MVKSSGRFSTIHVMAKKKKFSIVTVGPFVEWRTTYLPKCVYPQRQDYSTMNLNRAQRDYVLKCYGFGSYREYLVSDLWYSIRAPVKQGAHCHCGRPAEQVHHKMYCEANLLGQTRRGLVPICGECHGAIEFDGDRKCSLGEANHKLKVASRALCG